MHFRHIPNRILTVAVAGGGLLIGIVVLSVVLHRALVVGEETSLTTFSVAHFCGYLFFIVSPVEILFGHMLASEHSPFLLFWLAMGTAFAAHGLDYAIGCAFSETVVDRLIDGKKYRRHLQRIERYGGLTLFVFCLFPLSSPVVMLVAGIIRYPFRRAVVYSVAGLATKYLAIILFVWIMQAK